MIRKEFLELDFRNRMLRIVYCIDDSLDIEKVFLKHA